MHTFSVMQIYAAEFSMLIPIDLGLVNLPLAACWPNNALRQEKSYLWYLNHGNNRKRKNASKAVTCSFPSSFSLFFILYIVWCRFFSFIVKDCLTFLKKYNKQKYFLEQPDSLELCILVHILPLFDRRL